MMGDGLYKSLEELALENSLEFQSSANSFLHVDKRADAAPRPEPVALKPAALEPAALEPAALEPAAPVAKQHAPAPVGCECCGLGLKLAIDRNQYLGKGIDGQTPVEQSLGSLVLNFIVDPKDRAPVESTLQERRAGLFRYGVESGDDTVTLSSDKLDIRGAADGFFTLHCSGDDEGHQRRKIEVARLFFKLNSAQSEVGASCVHTVAGTRLPKSCAWELEGDDAKSALDTLNSTFKADVSVGYDEMCEESVEKVCDVAGALLPMPWWAQAYVSESLIEEQHRWTALPSSDQAKHEIAKSGDNIAAFEKIISSVDFETRSGIEEAMKAEKQKLRLAQFSVKCADAPATDGSVIWTAGIHAHAKVREATKC